LNGLQCTIDLNHINPYSMALWILLSKGALALLVALVSRSSVVPLLFVVVLLLLMLLVVTRGTPFVHDEDNTRSYASFATLVATYSGAAMLTEEDSQHISQVAASCSVLVDCVWQSCVSMLDCG
jgi:hypothetical protein